MLILGSRDGWLIRLIENVLWVGSTLTLACVVPSLKTVFSLAGATTSCMIVFILPPLFYLRITWSGETTRRVRIACIALLIFGVITMVALTVVSVLQFIHPAPTCNSTNLTAY